MKAYYVTVIRDRRRGWLYGPCASHKEALGMVVVVSAKAREIDPWCDFDAFGTSSIERDDQIEEFPKARLNSYFSA